jgi:hypothetical protein
MEIISRARWGARRPNGFGPRRLPATEAWEHHSVTLAPDLVPPFDDDYAAIRALEEIGHARFGAGISYTRLFTPAGLIFEGHGIDRIGSHTGGHNTAAVGYCLVGNYDTARPTDAQLRAVAWCLQHDHAHGWLAAPRLNGGHRDLKSTGCPGRYAYERIPDVNRLAAGPPITDLKEDFMAALTEQDQQAFIWRMEALVRGRTTVAGGPTRGEAVVPTAQLAGLTVAVAALSKNPDLTVDQVGALVDQAVAEHTPTAEDIATAIDTVQRPRIQEAVRAVLGEDNSEQADAIVDELVSRLANPNPEGN